MSLRFMGAQSSAPHNEEAESALLFAKPEYLVRSPILRCACATVPPGFLYLPYGLVERLLGILPDLTVVTGTRGQRLLCARSDMKVSRVTDVQDV
jgi:hypothetical protein